MFTITDDMVEELKTVNPQEKEERIRFALCKAINTIQNEQYHTREWIIKVAKKFIKPSTEVVVTEKQTKTDDVIVEKSKRGRKPLNKGKSIMGGTENNKKSFWDNEKCFEWAMDDKMFPSAQPKGNYRLVKEYLRNEWKEVYSFRLIDLQRELEKKYPEKSDHNGFKIQRWGDAFYWEKTKEIAVKPLWKRISRHEYQNIFYVGPE